MVVSRFITTQFYTHICESSIQLSGMITDYLWVLVMADHVAADPFLMSKGLAGIREDRVPSKIAYPFIKLFFLPTGHQTAIEIPLVPLMVFDVVCVTLGLTANSDGEGLVKSPFCLMVI